MLPRRCCVPVAKYLSRFSFYEGNDSKIVTLWPFLARRLPATKAPMPEPIMAIVLFVFPLSLSGEEYQGIGEESNWVFFVFIV